MFVALPERWLVHLYLSPYVVGLMFIYPSRVGNAIYVGNLMGFLEHIGNSLTSIQPWREFPPGHPRHGERLETICRTFFRNLP